MKKNKKLYLFSIIVLILITVYVLNSRDQFIYAFYSLFHDKKEGHEEICLSDYLLETGPMEIKCIKDNLSGITFNQTTKTLFLITNSPERIYETSKSGVCLREINLNNFDDTEGLDYLFENTYAIVEERRHSLHIVTIKKDAPEIGPSDIINSITINLTDHNTHGFEGIAYNKSNNCFYLVNEKNPLQLISIKGLLENKNINITLEPNVIRYNLFMDDFSDLHFDPITQHLLVLSHETRCLAEVNLEGKYISFMELKKGYSGLMKDIPQAEGVAMDDARNIYIVSEPNLFYKFVIKSK